MSEFEFVIPLKRDDLQVSVEGQYFVSEVLYHDAVIEKLEECINDLRNDGSTFILKHFDLLYSVMVEFNELDWNDIHKICDKVVLKSLSALCNFIEKALDNVSKDSEDRIESLNIVKMTLYIYSQFFHCYMNKMALKTDTAVVVKGHKKKTLNEQHTEEYCWDWESKQREGMVKIQTILQCQMLSNLWDPPVVEDTFVNMIADLCYGVLEQPSINLVRSKYLKETVINILGILIKFYNHGLSFVVKSVQLLKRNEHCASLLAEAVFKYIDQGGCKSLIKRLLEEIHEASELLSSVSDNHCSKSFSIFLVQLAESSPQDFEPELDAIILFLDLEVATLRSLGLCVLTEVLLGRLSGDNATTEIKNKQKKCLDALSDHMLDINAHVRAKVLQLWQKIVSQGVLPKDWIIPLMEDATDRLVDVSSIVTKQAVHLIRLMMETNPFAAMLSIDELTKTLEDETKEYELLKKNKLISSSSIGASKESVWAAVEPDLKDFLEQYFKEGSNLKAPPESPDIKRPHLQTINTFLCERNFCKATNLLIYAENAYAGLKDLRKGVDMSDVDFYLDFLKRIFFDNQNTIPANNKPASNDDFVDCNSPNVGVSNDAEDEIKSALAAQEKRVSFYYDCVEFVKHLNIATDKIIALLSSKQVFDVIDAIEFVKLAKKFGVAGSDKGVIQMMKLISCPEEGIRTCATRAFEQLYLKTNENATSPADAASQVVKNLCFLVKSMKLSQDDALNTLMKEWIRTSSINTYCIAAMISTLSGEQPGITSDDCVAALILFSSVVQSKPEYVNKNLDDLIQRGLSRGRKRCKNKDLRIARQVCVILQHASSNHPSKRFPNNHIIFKEIYNSIIEHFLDFNEKNYIYFLESAIDLWFKLALGPDIMCEKLLLYLHGLIVKKNRSSTNEISESSKASGDHSSRISEMSYSEVSVQNDSTCQQLCDKKDMCIQDEILTRFIFIIGHIALRACLYLEQEVLEEKKRRARLELKEIPQPSSKQKNAKEKNDEEEDDALNMAVDVAAANDDALTEEVSHICENEILYGSGIIAKYEYLPGVVLQNEGKYSDPRLKSVASVALGQFMLISNKYCRQNVQLFVTILEKTSDLVVKKNLVILFGELLFRHPNLMEPWITYLYSRLRDPCRDVRLNTLLVISHLITNEMVKVKSQISDVALCIVDSDEEIRETATRLFHELSLKGNTLYNVLPDIISTLSNPDASNPLSEENFQKILRYLIELIQKEKQMELLVEKLCVRLHTSETERQWSDLCFCLSLFSYSERSIRRLIDYYSSSFASKLYCPAVYNCLHSIIGSANKSSKPAVKEAAAELSAMLEESNKVGENLDSDENGDKNKSLGDENVPFSARKVSKFKTPRTIRKGSRGSSVKKSTRTTTGRKKATKNDSDDSDNDSENEFVRAPSSRPVRSTKRRLVIEESSDSDSD